MNRLARLVPWIVAGIGCGIGVTAHQATDVVRAKRFELLGEDGKVIARWYATKGGGARLALKSKDGGAFLLTVDKTVSMHCRQGTLGAWLQVGKDEAHLELGNTKTRDRVEIATALRGGTTLGFGRREKGTDFRLSAGADGDFLGAELGKPRSTVSIGHDAIRKLMIRR